MTIIINDKVGQPMMMMQPTSPTAGAGQPMMMQPMMQPPMQDPATDQPVAAAPYIPSADQKVSAETY